jgi:hypothetical protein
MQGLGATKSRLRNLLKYTDELLSFNEKVAFDLAREPYPHFHEFQVASLEGVDAALDDALGSEFIAYVKRARRTATRFSMVGSTLDLIRRLTSRRGLQQSAFSVSQ